MPGAFSVDQPHRLLAHIGVVLDNWRVCRVGKRIWVEGEHPDAGSGCCSCLPATVALQTVLELTVCRVSVEGRPRTTVIVSLVIRPGTNLRIG